MHACVCVRYRTCTVYMGMCIYTHVGIYAIIYLSINVVVDVACSVFALCPATIVDLIDLTRYSQGVRALHVMCTETRVPVDSHSFTG